MGKDWKQSARATARAPLGYGSSVLWTGSAALVAVSLVAELSKLQADLLRPLFSTSDSLAVARSPALVVLPLAALMHYTLPQVKRVAWPVYWQLIALSLMASETIVRLGAVTWMSFGAERGEWIAAAVLRGPTLLLVASWLVSDITENQFDPTSWFGAAIAVLQGGLVVAIRTTSSQPIWLRNLPWLQFGGASFLIGALAYTLQASPHESPTYTQRFRWLRTRYGQLYLVTVLLLSYAAAFASLAPTSPFLPSYLRSVQSSPTSRILASQSSLTGRIVVGEEKSRGMWFRYLRADHSLLGGLWVGPAKEALWEDKSTVWWSDQKLEETAVQMAESIYSTFLLQEIVRLADPTSVVQGVPKSGLIIGLGAGLAARALHSHGVNVTVVEIDPVVYDYARQYFDVPAPAGGAYLEDARAFLDREHDRTFDYIIHDVFTGGSVPSSLFTRECFASISRALTPDTGIVAINYAGNVSSVASQLVFSTILTSFPHCRAFEDGTHSTEYRNLVFICSPSADRPVVFRKPVAADYLPFPSPRMRRKVLDEFETAEMDLSGVERGQVVRDGQEEELERAQRDGVREHWELMKRVLPLETWAMY